MTAPSPKGEGAVTSVSRLKSILGDFEGLIEEPFSKFASTLNAIAKIDWPVLVPITPLNLTLSQKSVLRPHKSAALLNLRARGIFGTNSRADLITFFLVYANSDFSIAEMNEVGYSKRNRAEILEDFYLNHLVGRFLQGNQQRYRLNKESPLFQMLKPIPEYSKSWRLIFKVVLTIRNCLKRIEKSSESTQAIELINCLSQLEETMQKIELIPPAFSNDFSLYRKSFHRWILDWVSSL